MLEWLFSRKRLARSEASVRDSLSPAVSDPPPISPVSSDVAVLTVQQRIDQAVTAWAFADLAALGKEGMDVLVLCLLADDAELARRAASVFDHKVFASQATPRLAAVVDHPLQALRDASALSLLTRGIGPGSEEFAHRRVLEILARRCDERGVPSVRRLCLTPTEYTGHAVRTLEEMLKRKRVFAHLDAAELRELAGMPDVTEQVVGQEADRYETSVHYPPRSISCQQIRGLAIREIERRDLGRERSSRLLQPPSGADSAS